MDNDPADRVSTLRSLLTLSRPLEELTARLRAFPWNCDRDLVMFTRQHAANVLRRYLAGEFDARTVADWADAIEIREDIGHEPGHEDALKDLIFELANPDANYVLTPARAKEWLKRLQ
jgi:hypothetical protein